MDNYKTMIQKKICILGPTGAGKTSLIKQFVEGIFSEKYLTSIGVKIDKKTVKTPKPVQLMIWDLEGIDKFCGFNPRYLRGASAMVIVADHTRLSSLAEAMEILALARSEQSIPAVLVVNKIDLNPAMNWDDKMLKHHASSFNDLFFTSAKTGESVDELFVQIAKLAV